MDEITQALNKAVKNLFNLDVQAELEPTDAQFGDYSTNIAMRLSAELANNPRQIAEEICGHVSSNDLFLAEPAGPGFINFKLSNNYWNKEFEKAHQLGDQYGKLDNFKGKTVIVEYSDPNPFKVLHVGHLYTSVVGDALANLYENAGAKVYRVNFGGDVGLHVAKTMYAIIQNFDGENPQKLESINQTERSAWLSKMYVEGNRLYEESESAQNHIKDLNIRLYEVNSKKDTKSPLGLIYWTTRQWSYDYFVEFYKSIGSRFDKFYPESETAPIGKLLVDDGLKAGVFERSDGAVVFIAEKYDLHTRVFINKQGLPTYETKDLGLMKLKKADYNPDLSVIITGNEQSEYMKVVIKAMEQLDASIALKTKHITHGLVKLAGGQKMSSRKGNILGAEQVLKLADQANYKLNGKNEPEVSTSAVKYSFLKQRIGADLIFNPEESVSLQGNSGPYIQYAHARAWSITAKAKESKSHDYVLDDAEMPLVKKMLSFKPLLQKATAENYPHYLCTYLYELAGEFNRFYENNRVIGDQRQDIRLAILNLYKTIIHNGLGILNISAPKQLQKDSK